MMKNRGLWVQFWLFDDIMHHIIDLGTGEYALIGVHHSVESFIEIMNRENRVSDLIAFCRLCASQSIIILLYVFKHYINILITLINVYLDLKGFVFFCNPTAL